MIKNLFPSFVMELIIYESGEKIVLKGENNWSKLIFYHGFVNLGFIALSVFSLLNIIPIKLFPITLFTSIFLGFFSTSIFKKVRNASFLNKALTINKQGIYRKFSKDKEETFVARENIRKLGVTLKNKRVKIFINTLMDHQIEFILADLSPTECQKIAQDISKILLLEGSDNQDYSGVFVGKYMNPAINQTPQKITKKAFASKYFYLLRKSTSVILKKRQVDPAFKLEFDLKSRAIIRKSLLVTILYVSFEDIERVSYKLRNKGNSIDGGIMDATLFVQIKNGNLIEILKIEDIKTRNPELLTIELANDFKFLSGEIEKIVFSSPRVSSLTDEDSG